ncbi:hypothetical protein VII_000712 [Vibrio mimicus MB451]|nr:hypothetical protein VII_000712 [Vibrio mimicus MB451]
MRNVNNGKEQKSNLSRLNYLQAALTKMDSHLPVKEQAIASLKK